MSATFNTHCFFLVSKLLIIFMWHGSLMPHNSFIIEPFSGSSGMLSRPCSLRFFPKRDSKKRFKDASVGVE